MERKGWLAVGAFAALTVVVFVLGLRGGGAAGGASFADGLVPGDVDVVFRMDVGPMRRVILEPWMGSRFEEWPKGGLWGDLALEEEIKPVLLDRLGFHIHEVRRLTGFASIGSRALAVVLDATWEGTPKGDGDDYEGVTIYRAASKLYYAVVEERLVLGTKHGIRAVVDTAKGKAESLAKSQGLPAKRHRELAEAAGAAPIVVTLDLSKAPETEMKVATGGNLLEGVAVTLSEAGQWRLIGQGEPEALDSMKRYYEDMIASGLGVLEAQKEQAKKGADTLEAVMAILSTQGIKDLREKLVLERSGRHLEVRLEIEGAGAMMPMLGVMAAVAIPSFMRYMDRAKEARYDVEEQERQQMRMLRELNDSDRAFPADMKPARAIPVEDEESP